MNIPMEQYHGSIVKYILENAVEGTKGYFGDLPENFAVPSVYFPIPRTETKKAALNHWYRTQFHFECNFFARDSWLAYDAAVHVRTKLIDDDFWIPVYDQEGTETGYSIKCGFPSLDNIEDGTVNMSFDFDHIVDANPGGGTTITDVHLDITGNEGTNGD